jgi:hypothetical protein
MQNSSSCSRRASWHRVALWLAVGSSSIGALAGCARDNQAPVAESIAADAEPMDWEMQWAQAALQRNPNLEIVAVDRQSREFMVRDLQTDAVTAVQLAEIAAAPVAFLQAQPDAADVAADVEPASAAPTIPEVAPAAVNASTVLSPTPSANSPSSYSIDRSNGRTKVSGAGISVVYGDNMPAATLAVTPAVETPKPYTIDRSSGLIRASGPGISVESSGRPRTAAALDQTPSQVEIEPVICEGPRVMQLDSRTIRVEGDALTARGGCELYITNSTIVASGTGVVINDATVHINNSRIEGGLASFDAKEQAKVFLRGSTLNGLSRRNERALIQDQGGNSYR